MNSETKTGPKRKFKNRLLLGLIVLLLAESFLIFPAPKANAGQVCTVGGDGIPVCNGTTTPEDKISISDFPSTITLGQPFTFTVNVTSVEFASAPTDPSNNLNIWKTANVYICDGANTSCDVNLDTKTISMSDVPLAMTGGTGSFQVLADANNKLEWAQNLPHAQSLLVDVDFRGFDANNNFAEDKTPLTTAKVNTQIVAATGATASAPDFTITNTSGTFSNGVSSFKVTGSIGGVINPPNHEWHWSLSTNGGPFVPFTQIPQLASLDNHSEFTFPSGFIDAKSNYQLEVQVVDTSVNPPTSVTVGPKPIVVASSNNNSTNTSGGNDNCTTLGQTAICFLETIVTTLVNIVRGILIGIFTLIIAPIMQAVLAIQPHQADFATVIVQAWVVIRNLMNIIFILAMIMMAMATLLRVGESYNYKHLMMEVIFAALLVNFSLVIAQGILSIADTFQAQFLPHNADVIGRLAAQLIGDPFNVQTSNVWQLTGSFAGIVSSFVGLIFAFAAFLVFGAITVFLLIRIVALWVLLMISPIAYAFMALPITHHEATKWWKAFFQYAFFTPIMALFLNLCALIADAQHNYVASHAVTALTGDSSLAGFIANVLTNVLLIGCLFATLEIAKEFSIAGAGQVMGWVEHQVAHGTAHGLEAVKDWGLKKKYNATSQWQRGGRFKQAMFNLVNPELRAKEFMAASHHELEEAKAKAIGAASYLEEKRRTHGGDNKADVNAQRKIEASREAHFADNSKEQNLDELANMEHADGHVADKIGLMRVMMANGHFKDNISKRIKELKIGNQEFNAQNVGEYMRTVLGDSEQAKRFMAVDLTKRAQDAGLMEATNAYVVGVGEDKGKYIAGDAKVAVGNERVSEEAKKMLRQAGLSDTDQISYQKMAILNSIQGIDIEKRGSVKLNVKNYFKKTTDAQGNVVETSEIAPEDVAMIKLVAAGGAEAARGMTSGQRKQFLLTDKIDRSNGAIRFENALDAERFKKIYADDPQLVDFAGTHAAIALGITERRHQNFKGVPVSYGTDMQRPTLEVVTGTGVSDTLENGGLAFPYNAQVAQPVQVVQFGRKSNRRLTADPERAAARRQTQAQGGGGRGTPGFGGAARNP